MLAKMCTQRTSSVSQDCQSNDISAPSIGGVPERAQQQRHVVVLRRVAHGEDDRDVGVEAGASAAGGVVGGDGEGEAIGGGGERGGGGGGGGGRAAGGLWGRGGRPPPPRRRPGSRAARRCGPPGGRSPCRGRG